MAGPAGGGPPGSAQEDAVQAPYSPLAASLEHLQELPRNPTAEFIRSASSRLLGIDGRPTTVVGQASRREQNRQQMEASVDAEVMRRCFFLIAAMVAVLGVFFCLGLYFWIHAMVATVKYGDIPCDVPLNQYVWIQFGVWWIMSGLRTRPQDAQNPTSRVLIALNSSSASAVVVVVGFVWVRKSKTCARTNPQLFSAVEHLLYFQTAGIVSVLVFTIVVLVFLRWAIRTGFDPLGVVARHRGCEEAVHELPKVAPGDAELIDPEDGRLSECVICSEEYSARNDLVVVRTPCGHHFHEVCLAKWCRNHISCPICRADVGTARSPLAGSESASPTAQVV